MNESLFALEASGSRSDLWFSSQSTSWRTPRGLFEELDAEFGFTLDACASAEDAMCESYLSPAVDALFQSWPGTVWCNPPYGRELTAWLAKALAESFNGSTVVLLVPARTDTFWFHEIAMQGEIRFIRGRLKFGGARFNAPFPSMLVIFRGES